MNSGERRRHWPLGASVESGTWEARGWVVLAALPLLLLPLNKSWIFSYPAAIDAWVYFGYFTNLPGHWHAFPDLYYGTRLAWIIPGAFVHEIFPAPVANYVLHLAVYYTALGAFYYTLRRTQGDRVALFVAVLTGFYSYFLFAVGWNYVDGVGIAYYALTVALLTKAVHSRQRSWPVIGAGVAFAGAIHSNIVWAVFVPAFLAYYVRLARDSGRAHLLRDAAWFAAGFTLLTAALGWEAVRRGGAFWFFLPSVKFAAATALVPDRFGSQSPLWIFDARWLVVPAFAFAAALYYRIRTSARASSGARALVDQFLISASTFLLLELAGRPFLEFQYYASYLIPSMVLAAGPLVADALSRLSTRAYAGVVSTAFLVLLLTYFQPIGARLAAFGEGPVGARSVAFLAAALVLLKARTNLMAVLIFVCSFAITNIATLDHGPFNFADDERRSDIFSLVARADAALQEIDPESTGRFWYDRAAPLGDVFQAVASTRLWGYRLVSDRFPSLYNRLSGKDEVLSAGESLILLGEDNDRAIVDARATLGRRLQLSAGPTRTIAEGGVHLQMTRLETDVDRAALEAPPLEASADIFLSGSAAGAAEKVDVDAARNHVRIVTNRSTYDWQIRSRPLTLEPARQYLAEFDLAIAAGGAGVHIIAPNDGNEVLASRYWCRPMRRKAEYLSFDAKGFATVAVVLSNCGNPAPAVSQFSVDRLRVSRYRDSAEPRP